MCLAFLYLRPEQIVDVWMFKHSSVLGDPITIDQKAEGGLRDPK